MYACDVFDKCASTRMHAFAVCNCTCIQSCCNVAIQTYIQECTYAHSHTYVHVYIYTYIHTYMYRYTLRALVGLYICIRSAACQPAVCKKISFMYSESARLGGWRRCSHKTDTPNTYTLTLCHAYKHSHCVSCIHTLSLCVMHTYTLTVCHAYIRSRCVWCWPANDVN